MLNCKQGDLAVIVRSYAGNEGKIVRCLRIVQNWHRLGSDGKLRCGTGWVVDREISTVLTGPSNIIADAQLRPLRDGEGEDEMLHLVRKPVASLVYGLTFELTGTLWCAGICPRMKWRGK